MRQTNFHHFMVAIAMDDDGLDERNENKAKKYVYEAENA